MNPMPLSGPSTRVSDSVIALLFPPAVVEYESRLDRLESVKNARPASASTATASKVG